MHPENPGDGVGGGIADGETVTHDDDDTLSIGVYIILLQALALHKLASFPSFRKFSQLIGCSMVHVLLSSSPTITVPVLLLCPNMIYRCAGVKATPLL